MTATGTGNIPEHGHQDHIEWSDYRETIRERVYENE
jgi:hypothetical protein